MLISRTKTSFAEHFSAHVHMAACFPGLFSPPAAAMGGIMKNKGLLVIIAIMLAILLAFYIVYTIDMDRMAKNEPVLFSTWGHDYTPGESDDNPNPPETEDTSKPEEPENTVHWDYDRTSSGINAAVKLKFDLDYEKVVAECNNGELIAYDNFDGVNYPRGYSVTVPSGSCLYWSPMAGAVLTPSIASSDVISFTVYDNGNPMYYCSVSITSVPAQQVNHDSYQLVLDGGGFLTLLPGEDCTAVITLVEKK